MKESKLGQWRHWVSLSTDSFITSSYDVDEAFSVTTSENICFLSHAGMKLTNAWQMHKIWEASGWKVGKNTKHLLKSVLKVLGLV